PRRGERHLRRGHGDHLEPAGGPRRADSAAPAVEREPRLHEDLLAGRRGRRNPGHRPGRHGAIELSGGGALRHRPRPPQDAHPRRRRRGRRRQDRRRDGHRLRGRRVPRRGLPGHDHAGPFQPEQRLGRRHLFGGRRRRQPRREAPPGDDDDHHRAHARGARRASPAERRASLPADAADGAGRQADLAGAGGRAPQGAVADLGPHERQARRRERRDARRLGGDHRRYLHGGDRSLARHGQPRRDRRDRRRRQEEEKDILMVAVAPLFQGQPPIVELSEVSKEYDTGGSTVRAMRDVSLSIANGEFVAIVGTSVSGKSTMMNILGCLDRPTRGTYTLAGIDVGARAGDSRAIVRNRVIGFIFQGFNLLSRTTALENVELPLQYRGVSSRERRKRATAALVSVGLGERLDHTPNQLSGGQQQRVAIARALVTDPPLLLADEPTGNRDTRPSLQVLALPQKLNRDRGITIDLVTHERDIAACASRVVTMRDGRVVTDVLQDEPLDAATELANLPRADDTAAPVAYLSDARDLAAARVGEPVP